MKPLTIFLFVIGPALAALSQSTKEHATTVRDANLYVLPGASSERMVKLDRGRDLVILEHTNVDNQPWVKVFATITQEEREPRELTGWLPAKGVVGASTPNADEIIFGEAVDSEQQAEQRAGRKGSAQDAMRLYFRIYDFLPNSPLAGEALWRAADIRWQLEKTDVMSRPSSHELDPDVRNPMDDRFMKEIQKKFPRSKWSDLASYALIDNKLCGEWKGLAKCPDRESDLYEHYAHEHPQSPKAAEALYNAAWRQAALVDIYKTNNENDKSASARKKGTALAQEIVNQYAAQADWKARAMDLIYKLDQSVPVYGNQTE